METYEKHLNESPDQDGWIKRGGDIVPTREVEAFLFPQLSRKEFDRKYIHDVDIKGHQAATNFVNRLKVFPYKQIYGISKVPREWAFCPGDDSNPKVDPCKFAKKLPQWFVCKMTDNQYYLIDTEGYDYARYIGRLLPY